MNCRKSSQFFTIPATVGPEIAHSWYTFCPSGPVHFPSWTGLRTKWFQWASRHGRLARCHGSWRTKRGIQSRSISLWPRLLFLACWKWRDN
jgi:hypothetical protein